MALECERDVLRIPLPNHLATPRFWVTSSRDLKRADRASPDMSRAEAIFGFRRHPKSSTFDRCEIRFRFDSRLFRKSADRGHHLTPCLCLSQTFPTGAAIWQARVQSSVYRSALTESFGRSSGCLRVRAHRARLCPARPARNKPSRAGLNPNKPRISPFGPTSARPSEISTFQPRAVIFGLLVRRTHLSSLVGCRSAVLRPTHRLALGLQQLSSRDSCFPCRHGAMFLLVRRQLKKMLRRLCWSVSFAA